MVDDTEELDEEIVNKYNNGMTDDIASENEDNQVKN